MTSITNLVLEANSRFMKLAKPGDTLLVLAERIRSDPEASSDAKQRLNVAVAMSSTYEHDEKERALKAQQFKSNVVLGDAASLLRVYEASFDAEVRKLSKAYRISKVAAIKLLEKRIRETSLAAVLPNFAKAEKAIRARYTAAA